MDPNPATPPPSAPEPKVETTLTFQPGQKVRHVNRQVYTVIEHHAEGVRLEGVANFVQPSALRPVHTD